jgi:type IV secretion system protein VirB9
MSIAHLARSLGLLGLSIAFVSRVHAQAPEPRLREVQYDSKAVITVPVKRGVVAHILLDADESITDVASGLGGDCAKPEAVWCIAAQAGGRSIFVKAKAAASAPNNLAVVTDKRTHSLRFVVLPDSDPSPATHRLAIRAPVVRTITASRPTMPEPLPAAVAASAPSAEELVANRLHAGPRVVNSNYSIAEGDSSAAIVPALVFDDGRFTYFRFPGNREVPAVFHVLGDGAETIVNTRMEGDLLVVDRVSRQLMLRAGSAVVAVWNDAFDLDGSAPIAGTTVSGVQRVTKSETASARRPAKPGDSHD